VVGGGVGVGVGEGIEPGGAAPPDWACALAANASMAMQTIPATARFLRLLVKPSSFVAYGVS
jgi:hypothetical protein